MIYTLERWCRAPPDIALLGFLDQTEYGHIRQKNKSANLNSNFIQSVCGGLSE
jgi:hypothetical protein